MRRVRKIMMIVGGVVLGLVVLTACGWIYASQSVETPDYAVVEAAPAGAGDIEIRDYPASVVAEVVKTGTRYDAVRQGFRPLAGYIFAKERPGEKIAMTAPVTQRADQGADWTVQFIMPAEHDLAALPVPAGEVELREVPALRRAAIRFSGVATDALIAENEAKLTAWLAARGLETEGAPIYAYYNDPFTPGFLRRNEVLFDLKP